MLQISKFKELSFLVYGLGLTGKSVVNYFKRKNFKKFEVWDDQNKKILKKYRSKNLEKTLNKVDYIVLSPGISLVKNKKLRKYKKKIITDIDLFFINKSRVKSIMVTGTNGKSTTCKLLAHLLKKNGIKFSLGGNIGHPILNIKNFNNGYVIIEASSFQLSHSKFISPDFAFFLNLSNDHLDWHGNRTNYLNSKLNIFRLQKRTQYAIINKNFKKIFKKNNFLSKLFIPNFKEYKKIKFKIKNDYLGFNINDENMSFVYTFAKLLKIKERSFANNMRSFKGLPHRFEIFLKRKNIKFINDSKATSFNASLPALNSCNNIYWIIGGIPKKNDKINILKYKNKIIKCYLIGKNINFFKNQVKKKLDFKITKNLKNTITQISKDYKLRDNVSRSILLSPAAASFDQFENFEKRGEEFKRLCKVYVKKFL